MPGFDDHDYWAGVQRRAVERGRLANWFAAVVQAIVRIFVAIVFRPRVIGREHVPATGAVLICPNHRSLSDFLFVAHACRRRPRFLAMAELFRSRPKARLFLALGGIPVRRGAGDTGALDVAAATLSAGEALVVFPEGRIWFRHTEPVGPAKSGAGRLALQTGAPIVGLAMSGTDRLWRSALLPGYRVRCEFVELEAGDAAPEAADPTTGDDAAGRAQAARALVTERVWPTVRERVAQLDRRRSAMAATGAAAAGLALLAELRRRRR